MPDSTFLLTAALLLFAGVRSHWAGRLLVLLLLSPVLRYGLAIFGFTIRLWLSAWAGALLRLAGLDVQTQGNVLVRAVAGGPSVEMAVDPACMGLYMTGLSVLVAVFWVMWAERRALLRLPLLPLLAFGTVAFGLTILCNLVRIVVLVAFGMGPDSPLHEGVGLVCVLAYAWLPTWALAGFMVRKFGKAQDLSQRGVGKWQVVWGLSVLTGGLGLLAFTTQPTATLPAMHQPFIKAYEQQGFALRKTTHDGFYQLTRPGFLLYVKPLPNWWSAEHSPVVCWRGGGYELRRVREQVVGKHTVYTAELRHPTRPTLYTAWWFSNGIRQTIGQLDFRWQMLRGEDRFSLINITAERPFGPYQLTGFVR